MRVWALGVELLGMVLLDIFWGAQGVRKGWAAVFFLLDSCN